MNGDWHKLRKALDKLEAEGHGASFWIRDDDATSDTEALRKLANWASNAETEVLLALVPSEADDSLKDALKALMQLVPAVHGWAHKNHAAQGEKKQELGAHRPLNVVASELTSALRTTHSLAAGAALPVLVPPWNRISPEIVLELPKLGYSGLSAFANSFEEPGVPRLRVENTHLDLIDWRGTRGGRSHDDLLQELIALIDAKGPENLPIGILAHHLVHDDTAWSFLDRLADILAGHKAARWRRPQDLFCPQE